MLVIEREGLQGPRFRDMGLGDVLVEGGLLAVVILRAQEPCEELLVGDVFFLGRAEFLVEDFGDLLEAEVLEELFEVIRHRDGSLERWCYSSGGLK